MVINTVLLWWTHLPAKPASASICLLLWTFCHDSATKQVCVVIWVCLKQLNRHPTLHKISPRLGVSCSMPLGSSRPNHAQTVRTKQANVRIGAHLGNLCLYLVSLLAKLGESGGDDCYGFGAGVD